MADNSFKINKSANFNPQPGLPTNPVDGDFFYDSTAQSFAYFHNGSWANMDSVGIVTGLTELTGAQFTPNVVRNSVVKISSTGVFPHLNGMAASFSGKRITIYNDTDSPISVEWENPTEPTANNRIRTPSGGSMNLEIGDVAVFVYDIIVNRWLLVSISSQAGAFDPATTTSNGLVALHQASATPWEPIVFTDGDYNTATGFVGLDANRAAAIIAPLSAVTALTVTAHTSASALVLNHAAGTAPTLQLSSDGGSTSFSLMQKPGSDTDQFTLNDDFVQLGRRQLRFTDNDGFGNHLDNYMQYTYLGGPGRRGVQFVNGSNTGTTTFSIEGTGDGFGGSRVDLTLHATSGSDQIITNQQGNLYLNFLQAGNVRIGMASGGSTTFVSSSNDLWQFTGGGVLQAVGGNRKIANVLDPTAAQDAATKAYVDSRPLPYQNYVQNSNFRFTQRLEAIINVFPWGNAGTATRAMDRWMVKTNGSGTGGQVFQSYAGLYAPAFPGNGDGGQDQGSTGHVQRNNTNTGTDIVAWAQEIDRTYVHSMQGKQLSISFWAVKSPTWTPTSVSVIFTTGTGNFNQVRLNQAFATGAYPTGSQTDLTATFAPTTSWAKYTFVVPTLRSDITVAEFRFQWQHVGTAGTADWMEIADVMINEGPIPATWSLAGNNFAGELELCQYYFEKSYDWNTTPGTISSVGLWTSNVLAISATAGSDLMLGFHPRFKVNKRVNPGITLYSPAPTTVNNWQSPQFSANIAVAPTDVTKAGFRVEANATYSLSTQGIQGHWIADADF